MSSFKEGAWVWRGLVVTCCGLAGGCDRSAGATRDTLTAAEPRCPAVQLPAGKVCIKQPCAPSLCELNRKLKIELCAKSKVVLRETCADRIAITVSYGLGSYTFFYARDSGGLVGSSSLNDQAEEFEVGNAATANCREECVVCGRPNLPVRSCDEATRSEL